MNAKIVQTMVDVDKNKHVIDKSNNKIENKYKLRGIYKYG